MLIVNIYIVMLSVVYADCGVMLSVIMLSVIMLSVIMLSVVAPLGSLSSIIEFENEMNKVSSEAADPIFDQEPVLLNLLRHRSKLECLSLSKLCGQSLLVQVYEYASL